MVVLIESAIRAGLLALAAFAVLRVMRVTTASARHAVWTVVLAAMVVLPMWTLWGPKATIAVNTPGVIRTASSAMAVPVMEVTDPTALAPAPAGEIPTARTEIVPLTAEPEAPRVLWRPVVLAIYVAGVALLLGRLLVGTLRAQRLLRQAVPGTGFLTSSACSAPVTVGWIRPVVVLPEGWESWSRPQFEAVMLHEQEHARRRDPLVQWIAFANRAIFWFHPLAWWLQRHLAELAEEACDAAVLSRGHRPTDYCEYLLSMARAVTGAGVRVDVIGAAMPGAFLSQRIGRILDAAPESRLSASRLALALSACVVLSAVVMAGTLAPAAEIPRAVPAQSVAGQPLPDDWFADDEWHLEIAPLMSVQEMEHYKALGTSAERDAFIAGFWNMHDPTPGTSANEFRREFERRIRFAKQRFANPESAATFGYQTDRGRWYVSAGPPDDIRVSARNRGIDQKSPVEEWRYQSLDEFGSDVTVSFDLTAVFSCSWRGGKYRIESPAPLKRFEGTSRTGSGRRPIALTYPAHFVYISLPIDSKATAIKWALHGRSHDTSELLEARSVAAQLGEAGPADYVQGELGESKGREPILKHLAGLRFFEPEAFACTEQLAPGAYTLSIETTLTSRDTRTDSLAFKVE